MNHQSLSAPALSSRAAVAAAVTALALPGCANYFGMKTDKQISSPAQYESAQCLPGQGGQWPPLDWANQFGDPQLSKLIAQARARLAKASSYIERSRSALYPKVNGSYSWKSLAVLLELASGTVRKTATNPGASQPACQKQKNSPFDTSFTMEH